MLSPRANEIAELVRKLGSRSRTRVDASRARLTIIGARAVEELIRSLEGDNNTIRARVMPLLALIQDPRGREPLIAMLMDRNSRLREIAAHSLARFPSKSTVAALNRTLQRERADAVRVAAVQSLVQQCASGQEAAIGLVLELLLDSREPTPIRLAALSLLRVLRPSQRRSVIDRLGCDAHSELGTTAKSWADIDGDRAPSRQQLEGLIGELGSPDYAIWNEAVQRVGRCGNRVVRPLADEMDRRAHDPEFCVRAGLALKALGPKHAQAVADLLDATDEPVPLQVLVDVIGATGQRSLIYRLKGLIERLSPASGTNPSTLEIDLYQRVRAKAHLELARVGSRVAIEDLRQALADRQRRIEPEMLTAIGLIGKRDELALLLSAYDRESGDARRELGIAVRAIMKRDRLRRNNRMFSEMSAGRRRALEAILPPRRPRRRRD